MAHFRKTDVDGVTYEYKVGKQATFIKGIGSFNHQQIGLCVDSSMDQYMVSPRAVRVAIRWFLRKTA